MELPIVQSSVMARAHFYETHLIAPGSTITSAAAIVVEIGNVLLSMILTLPPGRSVKLTFENSKEKA